MKQTNNAIKFLMAQYRAIFKNANIAMVAAMAAAALAAGSANAAAAGLTGDLQATANAAQDIVVSSGSHDLNATGNKFAKSLTINKGASATIKSGGVTSLGDVNLNSGSLTVSGTDAGLFLGAIKQVESKDKQHYEYDLTATNRSTITLDQANIGVANFDIADSTIFLKSGGAGGTNLTAYGAGAYQNDAQPANLSYNAVGKLTDVTANLVGGTNITAIGHLDIKGSAQDKSVINLQGMKSGSAGHIDSLAYIGGSKKLTIDNTTINVKGGSDKSNSKGTAVVSPDLQITNSKIVVAGANDTLTLGGLADRNSVGGTKGLTSGDYTADTATIKNSNISITGGTLNLGHGADTKTSFNLTGNTIQNKGEINAYGDVTVDKVAGLFDSGNGLTGKLNLSGSTFVVTGANESIDLAKANINADAKSELFVKNGSITIAKYFEKNVGNVKAGTIVVSGGISNDPKAHYGVPSGAYYLNFTGSADITAFNELKGSQENTALQLNPVSGSTAKLTLGDSADSKGELNNILRVQVGIGETSGSSTLDVNGTWDFNNAGLYVANSGVATIKAGAEITNVERLKVEDDSITNIYGTANINRLQAEASSGSGLVNVYGTLNLRGDGKEDGPSSSKKYTNDVYLKKGKLNIHAGGTVALTTKDAWDDVLSVSTDSGTGISTFTVSTSGDNTSDSGAWVNDNVILNAGGTLRIDLSGYKVADKAAVDALAQDLINTNSKGLVDLGGIGIGTITTNANGSVDIGNMPNVKTEATKNLEVNVGSNTTLTGSYSMGSANVSGDSLTLVSGSTLEFNNAKNGQFATNTAAAAGTSSKVNVTLSANSAVNLNGNGSLGDIKKNGSVSDTAVVLGGENGTQTVGDVDVATFNQVGGNVTTTGAIIVSGDTTINGVLNAGGNISTATLNLVSGAINAAGKKIVLGTDGAALDSSFAGNVTADSLTLKSASGGNLVISDDASVKLNALTAGTNVTIQVGQDGANTSSATLEAGKLDLAGGALIVDPEFSEDAAIAAVKNLSQKDQATGAEVLNGMVAVGKNAAVGIGFGSRAEVEDLLSTYGYMVGGKFDKTSDLHGALVLNAPLKISTGNGVLIDTTNTAITVGAVGTNEFKMGANSGLVITDGAYSVDADGKKTGAAVTLESGGQNSVKIDGGKVILAGNFTAADSGIQLFSGTATTDLVSGTGIKLESANGLIEAFIGADGKVQAGTWTFDKNNKLDTYYGAAAQPVRDLLKSVMKGEIKGNALGNKFLGTVANSVDKSGVLADAAAHAATYAGAQQAAVASVTTMADAMFGRVGAVGVEAASISATGSQANGGVWLTPMYKSVDADGFNAQGASYGSEVDLGGVAFGADTVNGNMRFGAVFNIGSGDADGKGNGNGLKDEFDYYGFGIYSAMGFGNFALVGDASMTVISHDVEGHGLKGKADTTAVTMGLTGQYSIATPVVDVTPHLGARFIRLNTDSYDLMSADGVLATTDFDVQNVFSVPLGVTLSKGFVAGGWTLAPSADLTVAFNTGDTEAKSKTTFTGVPSIDLTTEVLDEVTYGVSLGLGAQNGAFGTSFGINYTGSSNTDSFGVNAQARYMF